eukprot:TRINITY_DN11333_c0_g2_i1.p1 TRINITY_DN11333_c0_g2~~TRINITY_DN11333_c0_g2_i1.p1  ORF type:complete len:656 (-),score=200.22 TRINITY_DN11333_c0_g2_i1:67-2034(-)
MAKNAAARKESGKRKKADNRGKKKGQGALKAGSALKKSNSASKTGRTAPNGQRNVKDGSGTHFRSDSAIKRLQMYRSKPNIAKMKEQPNKPVRIQPDRRWFGNTRVIAQNKMQQFRETLSKGVEDPYSVVLKSSKLPMSLLKETEDKASRMNLLSVEPFKEVFGKGRRQKRVKLGSYDMEGLIQAADKKAEDYSEVKDKQAQVDLSTGADLPDGELTHRAEEIFNKGTSKRIWGELYKVLDSSDVIVFVLDARDPMGTRCLALERDIKKNRPGKHIVLLLNKVDLVPTWVSRQWVKVLTKEYPTLAFHASITNPFGKNALLNLVRQFGNLLKERKHITVGLIGYPNVGKSSVINTMKRKKVCKAAPVPGETKVWQYIALTKKIYLLDCPGIVPMTQQDFESDSAKVLKGVVRAERIMSPSDYISEVLSRVKKQYLLQRYKLPQDTTWTDSESFLTLLGHKMGKLQKGGEPDIDVVARIVLYDWQRGRIPYFVEPPFENGQDAGAKGSGSSKDKAAKASEEDAAEAAEKEEGEEAGDADGDDAETSGVIVQQSLASLSEIPCALDYDEDDRRGEAPRQATAAADGEEGGEAAASSGAKTKRKASASGKAGAGGEASGKDAGPRKKKRKRAGVATREGMAVQQGSVDWSKVVSEFGM